MLLDRGYEENSALQRLRGPSFGYAVLAFAALVCAANIHNSHIERWDDAFITFRFAQHLATGQGLTWNVGGAPTEGCTSMLHVLVLALGIKAGVQPEFGSLLLSVVSLAATAGMMVAIVRRQLGSVHPAAAAVLGVYLVDKTTAIHTTSGLETPLFVFLLCAAYFAALSFLDSPRRRTALGLTLAVFLSVLCRPEGVVYGAALYGALALCCLHPKLKLGDDAKRLRRLLVSGGGLALLGLLYAAWKYQYFGYLLPNPYYVKSNHVGLWGMLNVLAYLAHVVLWLLPLALLVLLLALRKRQALVAFLGAPRRRAKVLVTLAPPCLALAYYTTIIHETGGAYRFSYPTYFYFIIAAAIFSAVALRLVGADLTHRSIKFAGASAAWLVVTIAFQGGVRLSSSPYSDFYQYHFNIAHALKGTGLGAKGTVLCDGAGVIPYVSGFNQLDRVGLCDNFLSGRQRSTPEEREAYVWNYGADVYVGYEPPATAGAQRPEDDPRISSPYVSRVLMGRKLKGIEDRIFVQDLNLLHARMKELRDNWDWVGEASWPGWRVWKLKSFIYVRKQSPYAGNLLSALKPIITTTPPMVNLSDVD